jgi:RHS repeat-associated protein
MDTTNKIYKHETKQTVNTRTYDTFGTLVNQTGSSSGNLGFQSKYYDQESGLNYYYHRYYFPQIERFINEEPIGYYGGLNIYHFEINNTMNFIDPFGLKTFTGQSSQDFMDEHEEWMYLFCQLWYSRTVNRGKSKFDLGSWLYENGGDPESGWWRSSEINKCIPQYIPHPSVLRGSVHTHSERRTASRPTDKKNPYTGDTAVADDYHYGYEMYIISPYGIHAYLLGEDRQVMTYKQFSDWCRCHKDEWK